MRIAPINLILITLLGTSCEKGIIAAPQSTEDKMVVEGMIEDGRYPMVILSRNTGYFSRISPDQLATSFVHGAKITVSNGPQTHQLREYKSDATAGVILYFYTVDTADLNTAFTGERTLSYTLKIEVEGKTIQAVTTIPAPSVKLDSMWWSKADLNDNSKAKLLVKVTDPPQRGNYVRYFTSRNSGEFLPGSVFDDQVANGTSFEMRLKAGIDKNQSTDFDADGYFKRGDTVTLKFCNVDHSTYDFWRSTDDAYFGNGSSTYIPNMGNIQGGLGYWGGYGVTYKTIIIPK